jgi:hypothetical protein
MTSERYDSMVRFLAIALCAILLVLPSSSFAQERRAVIDKSRLPLEANAVKDFIPPGWVMEEQVLGDLNGDATPDLALKLIQEGPAGDENVIRERHRALVILFAGKDGKLRRAAIADNLLQCTSCGGAFYGAVEAPANVKIRRRVLIVKQDHGSRNVTEQTFRFRYDPKVQRFVLIGLDISDNDRATGVVVEESMSFLTGVKVVTRSQYNKRLDKYVTRSTLRKQIAKKRTTMEQIDHEQY